MNKYLVVLLMFGCGQSPFENSSEDRHVVHIDRTKELLEIKATSLSGTKVRSIVSSEYDADNKLTRYLVSSPAENGELQDSLERLFEYNAEGKIGREVLRDLPGAGVKLSRDGEEKFEYFDNGNLKSSTYISSDNFESKRTYQNTSDSKSVLTEVHYSGQNVGSGRTEYQRNGKITQAISYREGKAYSRNVVDRNKRECRTLVNTSADGEEWEEVEYLKTYDVAMKIPKLHKISRGSHSDDIDVDCGIYQFRKSISNSFDFETKFNLVNVKEGQLNCSVQEPIFSCILDLKEEYSGSVTERKIKFKGEVVELFEKQKNGDLRREKIPVVTNSTENLSHVEITELETHEYFHNELWQLTEVRSVYRGDEDSEIVFKKRISYMENGYQIRLIEDFTGDELESTEVYTYK